MFEELEEEIEIKADEYALEESTALLISMGVTSEDIAKFKD